MREAFAADGIDIRTGGRVDKVEATAHGTRIDIDGGDSVEVDRVLVAIGRKPSTADMARNEPVGARVPPDDVESISAHEVLHTPGGSADAVEGAGRAGGPAPDGSPGQLQ